MMALIQRVLESSVTIESEITDRSGYGMLVLLGVKNTDTKDDAIYLASKTANLRIFPDENGKMNLSLIDTGFETMVVSQFTLYGDTRHGNRPDFTQSADAVAAEKLYELYIDELSKIIGPRKVHTGKFGAMMKVGLINDGPVTVILRSKSDYM